MTDIILFVLFFSLAFAVTRTFLSRQKKDPVPKLKAYGISVVPDILPLIRRVDVYHEQGFEYLKLWCYKKDGPAVYQHFIDNGYRPSVEFDTITLEQAVVIRVVIPYPRKL